MFVGNWESLESRRIFEFLMLSKINSQHMLAISYAPKSSFGFGHVLAKAEAVERCFLRSTKDHSAFTLANF